MSDENSDVDDDLSVETKLNFRAQLLTYAGIIGGALTILSNSDGLIRLTHFAKVIVSKWQEWSHYFWDALFSFVNLPIYKDVYLSFTMATMLLAAGIGGQLVWRKRRCIRSNWFTLEYVKGWHIPLGALILFIHPFVLRYLYDFYVFLIEFRSDLDLIFLIGINWPFSIPALLAFGSKWPRRERFIGAFYTLVILALLDAGNYFSIADEPLDKFTTFPEILVATVYGISAAIIMVVVKPVVFVKRLHSIVLLFVCFVVLNAFQQPFAELMVTLFG